MHQGRGTAAKGANESNTTHATENTSAGAGGRGGGVYSCTLDGMEIQFTTTELQITVQSLIFAANRKP